MSEIDELGPLEGPLRDALRAEAYRPPVRLTRDDVAARVQAARGGRAWSRPWLNLATAAGVAALAVAAGLSTITIGPPPRESGSGAGQCDASPATLHGTWSEVGGPHAFFMIEPGEMTATRDDERWLLLTRFDREQQLGATPSVWVEELATGVRIDGAFNSRVNPATISPFDEPAPVLPGALYLFEQAVPRAGCWRLHAAIDGVEVGSAIVAVAQDGPRPPTSSEIPRPTTAEQQVFCDGGVETVPPAGPGAGTDNCDAAIRLVRRARPGLLAHASIVVVQPMCLPRAADSCDLGAPYAIAVVLLAPPSSPAGWLALTIVGEAGPERVDRVALDLPEHIIASLDEHDVPVERSYRLDCGPLDPEPCAERAFAVIRAAEDDNPRILESVTMLDAAGSYTLRYEDGDWITGVMN